MMALNEAVEGPKVWTLLSAKDSLKNNLYTSAAAAAITQVEKPE